MTTPKYPVPTASGQMPDNDSYDPMLRALRDEFLILAQKRPLFHTDAKNLWEVYLSGFATAELRQHHNCHACRHFIERFGDLAVVSDHGTVIPAVWSPFEDDETYAEPLRRLYQAVMGAKITGVFLSSSPNLGTAETGPWHHFSLTLPAAAVYRGRVKSADQMMAEKKEDYLQMVRAFEEFKIEQLRELVRILDADALSRSEKFMAPAKWLLEGQEERQRVKDSRTRSNLLWQRVAQAPAGFCHPRTFCFNSAWAPPKEEIFQWLADTYQTEFTVYGHDEGCSRYVESGRYAPVPK